VSEETRRAPASFNFTDSRGTRQGEGEAVIDDDGVSVGSVTVAFLDADTLRAEDYRIEIGCWPEGRLELGQLGRRFDSFFAELRRSRNQARVAGLLAHGVSMPTVFPARALEGPHPGPVTCQVFDTHLTMVPEDGDPWQLPLGALTRVGVEEDPPAVVLTTVDGITVIGQLARRRDEFHRLVTALRREQARVLESISGLAVFADGLGIERSRLPRFETLVNDWSAAERAPCAAALLKQAQGGEPRLGFAQLLDPESDGGQRPARLPEPWAAFLLVPVGALTVLEILAGPSAATYLFEAPIGAVNRDLQLLHFRRAGLALSGPDAEPTPGNPHRLALRRLEPLRRLRAATRARVIHNDRWAESLQSAIVRRET
jgi:hypothetical protein